MTCLVALEYGNPDDVVKVSAYAAKMPDVQLNIREGEQYYLKDLLYYVQLIQNYQNQYHPNLLFYQYESYLYISLCYFH